MSFDYSQEYKAIVKAYEKEGGDSSALLDKSYDSLIISGHKALAKNETSGIHIKTRKIKDGLSVKVFIDDGVVKKLPVHLCFGMLPKEGKQVIKSEFFIGDSSKVKFIAHCSFPNAKHIIHIMDSKIHIARNAEMEYAETHYHSMQGGVEVYPKLRGRIEDGGRLKEEFKLIMGRVGLLKIDYEVEQLERSICELNTKVYGKRDDRIEIREALMLNGEYASGIAKSRIVLKDRAYGNVFGEIQGNAAYTRGHTDCQEVVYGKNAVASSTPSISVRNPLAKITHEASIGRIDKKELETLMARGLEEEEAVDLIVKGILK
ncbi:MAG: hypothetical protein B5M53_00055 [Candidatus Cloacimonas sp. 4484_209]|nr:MAG: hypothetical protein B5M53_00055 [Candidatus Cloacimonas sp. 4484_209]